MLRLIDSIVLRGSANWLVIGLILSAGTSATKHRTVEIFRVCGHERTVRTHEATKERRALDLGMMVSVLIKGELFFEQRV